MNRGDVFSVNWPTAGEHPAVIVTRQGAIPFLRNVAVVLVTTTVRDLPTEVPVGRAEGLDRDSVINCDNVLTVPKEDLGPYRGRLGIEAVERLNRSLAIALGLD